MGIHSVHSRVNPVPPSKSRKNSSTELCPQARNEPSSGWDVWLQVFDAVGDKGGKGAELSRLHKACGKAAFGLGPSLGRWEGWTLHGTCFLPVGEESWGQNLSCVPSADQW